MTTYINNRYELREKLGQGGMGTVHLAHDRLTTKTVALKQVLLPDADPNSASDTDDQLLAIAVEFRTLAGLRHPHIISVMDYGFNRANASNQQPVPYFTMDYLAGGRNVLAAADDKPLADKVRFINQILLALDYLHRHRVIHRDLKPDNVLVTAEGTVKVLDFGLAQDTTDTDLDADDAFAGTIAYMAPELFTGGMASIASDLYAVGMIAYEMFVGTYPFERTNITSLMMNIIQDDPDTTMLDFDLGELLDALLAKDPEQRPADAFTVIEQLCAATGQPLPAESTTIRESFLQASKLVGRDAELNTLRTHLTDMLNGKSTFFLIGGESGVGKSRLVDELRSRALVKGADVLRGQGVAEGGLRFQLWRDPVRRLVLRTDLTNLEAGILKAIIPDITTLLGRDVPDAPELSGKAGEDRVMFTIVELFKRQPEPIVLILEDLQWTAESLSVLTQMLKVAEQFPKLLVIGTYRDDEAPELSEQFPAMTVMPIKRLNADAIADLSASMLGEAGKQANVVDLLQRETEGNAFFMVEVVRTLAEDAGRLSDIGKTTLPTSVFAGGVQQVVRRRLDRLPESIQEWLKPVAVAGRTLDMQVVSQFAQTTSDEVLRLCANAAVLEVEGETWRFSHDKIRETVIADLSADEVKSISRQVAEAIEAAHPDDDDYNEALREYWQQAGNIDKELVYLEPVAQRLIEIHANYEQGVALIQRGLDLLPDDDPQRLILLNWQARSLASRGEFTQAKTMSEESYTLAAQLDNKTAITGSLNNLGIVAGRQGHFAQADEYFQQVLDIKQEIGDQRGIAGSLNNLGLGALYTGDLTAAAEYLQRSLSHYQAVDDQQGIALSLNNLGLTALNQADFEAAADYLQRSLNIYRAIGDQRGTANNLLNLGLAAYYQQNYTAADDHLQHSLNIFHAIGEQRGIANSLANLGYVYSDIGRHAQAQAVLYKALRLAHTIGAVPLVIECLVRLCRLAPSHITPQRLAELISFAQHNPAAEASVVEEAQNLIPKLQAALSPDDLTAALEAGKSLDLDTVVTELLAEFTPEDAP